MAGGGGMEKERNDDLVILPSIPRKNSDKY